MGISLVILGLLCCVAYPGYPGVALLLGFAVSISLAPAQKLTFARFSKLLLAWAIVGLGFTVTLPTIYAFSRDYFLITALSIAVTLLCSWGLARLFGVSGSLAALIGSGTAICGASAIASVGGGIKAPAEQLSMALGVVLILNAIALTLFPILGGWMQLSPEQFAVWAGLAIHDTSSVVAAALAFAPDQVGLATTVKLARAIWIAPVTLLMVRILVLGNAGKGMKLPWFIWGYLGAALVATLVGISDEGRHGITTGARTLFAGGLFLTGAATNIATLARLGAPPLLLGVLLWIISAITTLGWILLPQ